MGKVSYWRVLFCPFDGPLRKIPMSLFMLPDDPSLLSYGIYDPKLVLLSLLVAIFSSWMGLQLSLIHI